MKTPEEEIFPCEQEPIRMPGKIQPFASLIGVDPIARQITHCSDNFSTLINRPITKILGSTLTDICGEELGAFFSLAMTDEHATSPIRAHLWIETMELPIKVEIHYWQTKDHHLIELEPISNRAEIRPTSNAGISQAHLVALQLAETAAEICQILCKNLSEYLGFDRVVAYRFDHDWNGQVIAETLSGSMSSLLNFHYPASDIPGQARALYHTKLLRYMPDTHYQAVKMVTTDNQNVPLDLSQASSRAISPVHLEYLRNMGLGANISISILDDQKLWGMIIAHHPKAKAVSCEVRQNCMTLVEIGGLHITNRKKIAFHAEQLKGIRTCQNILASVMQMRELFGALNNHRGDLLNLVSAEGFCYLSSQDPLYFGKTPDISWIESFVAWFRENFDEDIMLFNSLQEVYSQAECVTSIASGVAILRIPSLTELYFVWFRPEVVNTITWAGDPEKPVRITAQGRHYSPRKTFQAWKQTLRGKCVPWQNECYQAIEELRDQLYETLLSREERIASLSEELHLLKKAVDASSQGMVLTDPNQADNPIVYVNRGFLEMTGYTFSDIVGKNCRFLQGDDHQQPFIDEIREAIMDERKVTGILRNYRKDGTLFYNEITIAPVFSRNGALIHFVGLQIDVTGRIQAQQMKDELEAQLLQSQKIEAMGTLAGGIAHDMNNILAPVLGYIELAGVCMETDFFTAKHHLDRAIIGTERAKALVKQILDFSRKSKADKAVANLLPIVEDSLDFIRKTIRSNIQIVFEPEPTPMVFIDTNQIQQVFFNLAINAVESMPSDGTLTVKCLKKLPENMETKLQVTTSPYCGFSITDTGIGVEQKNRSRIFEPFFTTKGKSQSSGLGLSVALGIVQTHGGILDLESVEGQGSTFSVLLPVTDMPSATEKDPLLEDQSPIENLEVVIVDDDQNMANFMANCMQALKLNYRVFHDPESVLKAFNQGYRANVAMIDFMLPSMNGLRLAKQLKSLHANLQVIICSGFGYSIDPHDQAGLEILGILEKPFRFEELKKYLRSAKA